MPEEFGIAEQALRRVGGLARGSAETCSRTVKFLAVTDIVFQCLRLAAHRAQRRRDR